MFQQLLASLEAQYFIFEDIYLSFLLFQFHEMGAFYLVKYLQSDSIMVDQRLYFRLELLVFALPLFEFIFKFPQHTYIPILGLLLLILVFLYLTLQIFNLRQQNIPFFRMIFANNIRTALST